jgi:hypothetical protein
MCAVLRLLFLSLRSAHETFRRHEHLVEWLNIGVYLLDLGKSGMLADNHVLRRTTRLNFMTVG